MGGEVIVLPRVMERHPDVTEADVMHAWRHAFAVARRDYDNPSHYAAAGADPSGRVLEMVAVGTKDGGRVIYHAMRLTAKMAAELGL